MPRLAPTVNDWSDKRSHARGFCSHAATLTWFNWFGFISSHTIATLEAPREIKEGLLEYFLFRRSSIFRFIARLPASLLQRMAENNPSPFVVRSQRNRRRPPASSTIAAAAISNAETLRVDETKLEASDRNSLCHDSHGKLRLVHKDEHLGYFSTR